jgi:hypothetical protein
MKKIFTTLLIGAMSGYAYAQENTKEVQAEIKTVTVFLEGAQVSRQARVALESGVTTLSFGGIAPGINEQSIQVSASSSVSILSVSFSVNYLDELKKPERLRELENEHKRLNDLIAQEQSLQAVYREEEVILKTNKSIGGTTEGVRTDELKVAMDYFRARLLEINNLLQESGKRVDGYTHNLARTDAQLMELKALKPQPSGEIVVKVSVAKNVLADLNIRYLVENARWFPSYDIRAVDVRSPVSITYKANVTQQSGEDWDNVTLTVSSANPSQGGARPIVRPWIIGFNNRLSDRTVIRGVAGLPYGAQQVSGRVVAASDGSGIPGANILIKGTSVGTTTDADGNFSLTLTADARVLVISFVGYGPQEIPIANQEFIQVSLEEDVQQLSETVAVGYGLYGSSSGYSNGYAARVKKVIMATPVVRQTDIEFTVQEPVSIASDGETRTTDMVAYELDALFEYFCAPKLDKNAFLTAKILHWDEFNFLEGEASLFFEGKYIGKSILDSRNTSDTLMLSLGRDAGIVINREKIKDLSSRQFMGGNNKVVLAYEINVRNSKADAVSIVIEDQVPIPNTREINVDTLEFSDGEYNDETGSVTWRKEIAAGSTETIQLKYAVRYPKYNPLILE